jgi:hypothetical protein
MVKSIGELHREFIAERAALVRRGNYTDADYLQEWPALEEKHIELARILQKATVLKRERLLSAKTVEDKLAANEAVDIELFEEFQAACRGYIFYLKLFVE